MRNPSLQFCPTSDAYFPDYLVVTHHHCLDGELCLHDGNNGSFLLSSPFLAVAGKHGKLYAMRVHNPQAISDRLNQHSLGTVSAFGYIENFPSNSTCLNHYQEITRSI